MRPGLAIAGVVSLALIAVVVFFALGGSGDDRRAIAPELVVEDDAAARVPAELVPGESDSRTGPSSVPDREDVAGEAMDEIAGEAAEIPRVSVEGSVVVLDIEDVEYANMDGTLHVLIGEEPHELDVSNGKFRLEVTPVELLTVDHMVLAGGDAAPDGDEDRWVIDEDTQIFLRLRYFTEAVLRVIARDTDQDLTAVVLVNSAGWNYEDEDHPGDVRAENVFDTSASSPIVLPPRAREQTWWARAPGYSWGRCDYDHRYGGERTIYLDPEAILTVRLFGRRTDDEIVVRLRRRDERLTMGDGVEFATRPHEDLEIEGLSLGVYEARAILVDGGNSVRTLAHEEVELESGPNLCELTLPARAEDVTGVLGAGTLDVPLGREDDVGRIEFRRLDGESAIVIVGSEALEPVDGVPNRFAWESDGFQAGLWEAEVEPFGHVEELRVARGGTSGVRLVVPPLAEVTVVVIDRETRERVLNARVNWFRRTPDGEFSFSGGADELERGLVFHAVPGVAQLHAESPIHHVSRETVTLHPGNNELEVEVDRSCIVRLTLKEGTTVIPAEIGWWIMMSADREGEGDGIYSYSIDGSSAMEVQLEGPGRYELRFPALEGYRPIEAIEVDVEAGTMELTVPLEK